MGEKKTEIETFINCSKVIILTGASINFCFEFLNHLTETSKNAVKVNS